MPWFSEFWKQVSKDESIDFTLTGAIGPTATLPPGDCYLTVKVVTLRLPFTRQNVVERIYGVVHAFAHLNSPAGGPVDFAATTMPSALAGVDPNNIQNVLTIDKIVVGPTPWIGGDFQLEIGLFSVVSENLAGPFLETMSKLTETVGVGFAGAAKPFVDTLRFGIQSLTRAKGSVKLEVGHDRTFSPPVAATYALVAAAVGGLAGKTFSIDPNDRKLVVDGKHYTDKPYLVFAIEASTERADWGRIPELTAAYDDLKRAIKDNKPDDANDALASFRRQAMISSDLIPVDAARLIQKVTTLKNAVFPPPGLEAMPSPESAVAVVIPEFHELGLYDDEPPLPTEQVHLE